MENKIKKKRIAAEKNALIFADGELRQALKWSSGSLEMKSPDAGDHSVLYFVTHQSGQRVMLRVYDRREDRVAHHRALRLGHQHGLAIPRILHCGNALLQKLKYGTYYFVTAIAPGDTIDRQPATAATRHAVATALAGLHRVESNRWGDLDSKHFRKSYAQNMQRALQKRLDALASNPSDLSNDLQQKISKWFHGQLACFENLKQFQLCHHHLHPDDILYDAASDTATIIDCISLQYSRASRDLANFRYSPWIAGEENWQQFYQTYLTHSRAERAAQVEAEGSYFNAYRLLCRLSKTVARAKGPITLRESARADQLELMLQITGISQSD